MDAWAVARDTVPNEFTGHNGKDPSGLAREQDVIIRADDTGRDPVRGRLLAADGQRIVIRCENPRVGEVNVHFPRAGFDVTPA